MPKYGFKGNMVIRCTEAQTVTLLKMLHHQGVQPAALGRELIAAACAFLEAGGRLEFPLAVRPAAYEPQGETLVMAAEGPGPKYSSLRAVVDEAATSAAASSPPRPSPPGALPDPPKSRPAAKGSRGNKSPQKRGGA